MKIYLRVGRTSIMKIQELRYWREKETCESGHGEVPAMLERGDGLKLDSSLSQVHATHSLMSLYTEQHQPLYLLCLIVQKLIRLL